MAGTSRHVTRKNPSTTTGTATKDHATQRQPARAQIETRSNLEPFNDRPAMRALAVIVLFVSAAAAQMLPDLALDVISFTPAGEAV